ncbi:MAG: hypothetical protein JO189_07440 [Deltaproteobacteria bacterium]|nr:hypothetical protein [Deltaproteobacteria bacterium]
MPNHASARTIQLYDRRSDEVTLDEVERVGFEDFSVWTTCLEYCSTY